MSDFYSLLHTTYSLDFMHRSESAIRIIHKVKPFLLLRLAKPDKIMACNVVSAIMNDQNLDHSHRISFAYDRQATFEVEKLTLASPNGYNETTTAYSIWVIFNSEEHKAEYILTYE